MIRWRSSPTAEGSAPSADGATAELEALVADLELRLEQSEARARSAYTAAEAAEATLRMAREGSIVPSTHSDQELRELKTLLEKATKRADEAEQARRTMEADLAAYQAGVDPNAVVDPMASADAATAEAHGEPEAPDAGAWGADASAAVAPGVTDAWAADSGGAKGLSLRSRLAGAAASKKPRTADPDNA